ncbi:MAG: hypothetical protein ACO1SX_24280 [Actinomycetota bacterium]
MTDTVTRPKILRASFVLASLIGLTGAGWSVLKREGCDSCNSAAVLAGDLNLGLIGLIFYAGLAGASFWLLRRAPEAGGPSLPRALAVPALLAAGVHLTLVALLAKTRLLCPSCLITAAGAFTAAALVVSSGVVKLRWSMLAVSLMAVSTYGGLKAMKGNANQVAVRQGHLARQVLAREAPPANGSARLVVFVHPTCHVCERFKKEVLSPLRKELASGQLAIEERPAWTGMATPTSVVLGKQSALLVGFKELPVVRQAVEAARGVAGARQATLPDRS